MFSLSWHYAKVLLTYLIQSSKEPSRAEHGGARLWSQRLRQEDLDFQASLDYIARPCLNQTKPNQTKQNRKKQNQIKSKPKPTNQPNNTTKPLQSSYYFYTHFTLEQTKSQTGYSTCCRL
jgi:hypothetical protein